MSIYRTTPLSRNNLLAFLFLIAILITQFSCSKNVTTVPTPDSVDETEDTNGNNGSENEGQEPEDVWSVNRDGQNTLNVVFFKPSDYDLSNETINHVSTMLLYLQKWYEKHMELNGYGKKAFGLITNQNNKVRIHVINDNQTASYYRSKETQNSYSTLGKLNDKVAGFFASNPGFKTSSHSLILSIEETLIRFVGSGKNVP